MLLGDFNARFGEKEFNKLDNSNDLKSIKKEHTYYENLYKSVNIELFLRNASNRHFQNCDIDKFVFLKFWQIMVQRKFKFILYEHKSRIAIEI